MHIGAPVLGRLPDFPDGAAAPAGHRADGGREVAVLVVRRGAELRAYLDLCPHVFPPLTHRGRRVLSGDGERLRCSNLGAEFAVSDGRGLSGPGGACGLTPVPVPVPVLVGRDGTVRVDDDRTGPAPDRKDEEGTHP